MIEKTEVKKIREAYVSAAEDAVEVMWMSAITSIRTQISYLNMQKKQLEESGIKTTAEKTMIQSIDFTVSQLEQTIKNFNKLTELATETYNNTKKAVANISNT